MLTMTDKERKGVGEKLTMADEGGRGGSGPPPFLAYIICEQPLKSCHTHKRGNHQNKY